MPVSLEHLTIEDITDDPTSLKMAVDETASGYAKLAKPPLDPQTVASELMCDAYAMRSRHLAAVPRDKSLPVEFAGGVRVVYGSSNPNTGTSPVEAYDLLDLHDVELGHPLDQVAELTRFTVPRSRRDTKSEITGMLFDEAVAQVKARGVVAVYAVMPDYMVKLVTDAGINATCLGGNLKDESHTHAQKIYNRYNIYWCLEPKFYKLDMVRRPIS